MELKKAIERLKELQRWYKEGNMSTTIESSELEALCVVLQALEVSERELKGAREFINEEEEAIIERNNKICELEYKLKNSISKAR